MQTDLDWLDHHFNTNISIMDNQYGAKEINIHIWSIVRLGIAL